MYNRHSPQSGDNHASDKEVGSRLKTTGTTQSKRSKSGNPSICFDSEDNVPRVPKMGTNCCHDYNQEERGMQLSFEEFMSMSQGLTYSNVLERFCIDCRKDVIFLSEVVNVKHALSGLSGIPFWMTYRHGVSSLEPMHGLPDFRERNPKGVPDGFL
ncbi:hypothetical protein BDN67DRAFT_986333 [Paxillus ammoniavirescens]|nr:hypothetical protein BDN67DRAFT_986333 [Paxillus ammoniavirescens]